MSGGASYGAYQVGALLALETAGLADWDIYCGTSVGAINGAHMAQYRRPADGVRELKALWDQIDTSKVHKSWALGYLSGLWRLGFRDASPLRNLIKCSFSPARVIASGKRLRILAVSLQTYKTHVWDEESPNLVDVLMASSARPIAFPAVKIGGEYWIDGGVRDTTPLQEAIDLGATDIDVILTYSLDRESYREAPKNAIEVGLRSLEIMNDEIAKTDVKLAMAYSEMVLRGIRVGGTRGKRPVNIRVFQPSQPFGGDPMSFEPEFLQAMIQLGERDAQEVLRG
jgi:NTE family protein